MDTRSCNDSFCLLEQIGGAPTLSLQEASALNLERRQQERRGVAMYYPLFIAMALSPQARGADAE
jgi:hypothetical protein